MVSILFNPNYPARVGIPLRLWGLASTFRTLTNAVWGLPKQAHKSLYLQHRSLALLFHASDLTPSFWNNTHYFILSLIIELYRFPSIRRTIHLTSLGHINAMNSLQEHETDWIPFHVTAELATSPARVAHKDTRSPGDPDQPTVDHKMWNTYPHHSGPYK